MTMVIMWRRERSRMCKRSMINMMVVIAVINLQSKKGRVEDERGDDRDCAGDDVIEENMEEDHSLANHLQPAPTIVIRLVIFLHLLL